MSLQRNLFKSHTKWTSWSLENWHFLRNKHAYMYILDEENVYNSELWRDTTRHGDGAAYKYPVASRSSRDVTRTCIVTRSRTHGSYAINCPSPCTQSCAVHDTLIYRSKSMWTLGTRRGKSSSHQLTLTTLSKTTTHLILIWLMSLLCNIMCILIVYWFNHKVRSLGTFNAY